MTLELQIEVPMPPRERRIRSVFEAHGSMMTIGDLARACIDEGIWSRDELDRIAIRSVEEKCRRTLRNKDAAGIPENGPTTDAGEGGQPVWKTRQLWVSDDYALNVRTHLDQRDEEHAVAVKLVAEWRGRYPDSAALIPPLPLVGTEGARP